MDATWENWISELEHDDYYLIDQYQTNSTDQVSYVHEFTVPPVTTASMEENYFQQQSCSSSESQSSSPAATATTTITTVAFNDLSIETCCTTLAEEVSPESLHISLDDNKPLWNVNRENSREPKIDDVVCNGDITNIIPCSNSKGLSDNEDINAVPKVGQKRSNDVIRTPSEAQDRVIAERKRREKLNQRFIALSACIPGLKKMDKASILGDAIKYLKQLEENAKLLQEKMNQKTEEPVVFVKKSQLSTDVEKSFCDENFDSHINKPLPKIQARISEKTVLIKIHCENQKGFVVKLLTEIEKNHLSIVNSSLLPFGKSAIDITVVAQMDAEFCTTARDLVTSLRSAFLKFIDH